MNLKLNLKQLLAWLMIATLVFSHAALTLAQTPNSQEENLTPTAQQKEEQDKEKARRELEKKALAMLDEVIGDAQNLHVAENRARILAGAADLLWSHDEKRARELFRDVARSINEAAGTTEKNEEQRNRGYWVSYMMRQEFLGTVARRDPQLALELLYATRQPPQPSANGNMVRNSQPLDQEVRLEQSLAIRIAENDPKRALQIAEESVAKGISFEVLSAVNRLQAKDPEAASKLVRAIISRLRTENLATNPEAMQVGFNLLRTGLRPQTPLLVSVARTPVTGSTSGARKPLTLDAQAIHDLIDILVSGALDNRSNNFAANFAAMLQPLMSEVEKYAPERAPLVRRRIEEFNRTLDPRGRMWNDYGQQLQGNSADALIEAAAKVPSEMRNTFYSRAAWLSIQQGDTERARQIINDYLKDSPERAQMLAQLDRAVLLNSIKQGKLDDARKLVSQIASKEQRVTALMQLAAAVITGKGERKAALELLNEAQQLAGGRVKTSAEINTQLQLARVYALAESPRAFEIVEAVIDRANDMIAAAEVLDGFMGRSQVFRDGELVMSYGIASLDLIYSQYGRELAALARADFERSSAAAAKFQRVEVRTMAKLLIAQGLLSDRQPSETFNDGMLTGDALAAEGD